MPPLGSDMPQLTRYRRWLARLPFLLTYTSLDRLLRGSRSVLDVGCGASSPLRNVKFGGKRVGIDGFPDALAAAGARGIHDEYRLGDIRALPFPDKSFDAVVAFEVIEHLPKEDGRAFLSELERVADKLVVVTTPNGFVPQGDVDGNPYQRHLSGWTVGEMRSADYVVRGIHGLKGVRGEEARIVRRPKPAWWLLTKLSEPFVFHRPGLAFGLLCHKRLR
jgi:SAM-dependent methyltransferase